MGEPTVAAGLASALSSFAQSRGASAQALAARAAIDPGALKDLDARVPFGSYVAMMRAAKEMTGDPALALHFGEAVDLTEFSILGFMAPASGTIMEGIEQLNRFARLLIEVDAAGADRFQMTRRDGKLWLVDTRSSPNDFPELTESTFARMVGATRRFGLAGAVAEVHVTHAEPAYRAEYDRIFQAPVVFESGWNAVGIEEAMLARHARPQPGYASAVMRGRAEALLKELEDSESVRGRVEKLLAPMLPSGTARVDAVARGMNLSRQTLYRKLKSEGVSFAQVLDQLRHRLAAAYLFEGKLPVSEIAYRLGFSDRAGFSRAFKRWTGTSPAAARRTRSE